METARLKGLMGKKLGMTRIFGPFGLIFPVTVIQLGPCYVTQKKTRDRDGYEALQLGFEPLAERKVNKPLAGHLAAAGKGGFRYLREFKVDDTAEFDLGQELTADLFTIGERVHVTGTTKGRGFAGVTKRHGFARGPETHGCTTHRAPGSIGTSATPSRVLKGQRLPGHMGDVKKTTKNLKVIDVRPSENVILIQGAVPGAKGGLVILRKSEYRSSGS